MRYLVWEELETTGENLEGTTGDYLSNWVMNVNVVGQRTYSVDSPQDGDWAIPRERELERLGDDFLGDAKGACQVCDIDDLDQVLLAKKSYPGVQRQG